MGIDQLGHHATRMNGEWDILLRMVLAHLPDGISERRSALNAVVKVLPMQHALHSELRQALSDLDSHILRQRELALGLTRFSSQATRGSARLGDRPAKR